MSYENIPDEELEQMILSSEDVVDEITTQHLSECSLYGDSWPGAQIQIRDAEEHLKNLKAEAVRRWGSVEHPPTEDIPF